MHNLITIHDVAKRAGVSIGTVSNVINQKNKVAPDTTERILDAIKELNYIPVSYTHLDVYKRQSIGPTIPGTAFKQVRENAVSASSIWLSFSRKQNANS